MLRCGRSDAPCEDDSRLACLYCAGQSVSRRCEVKAAAESMSRALFGG
jgi:hypothetical protein